MKTTIQVNKSTLNKLKEFKISRRDSYDEIILRLMEKKIREKNEKILE